MMRRLLFLLAVISLTAQAWPQAWSGILAPARAVTWEGNVGIPGGIPSGSYTQCGSTIASGASTATIQAAVTACTANHYVLLGTGSFTLTADLHNNQSNVVLRGSGPTATTVVLNGSDIFAGIGAGGQGSHPGTWGATGLSTLTQGSTVLTVTSTTGLSVGQIVQIDQLNDTTNLVNVNGNGGSENAGRCTSIATDPFSGCNDRAQLEMVKITAIGAGTITIAAPGLSHDYTSGLNPQVFFWSGSTSFDGVENMLVDAGDGSAGHAASDFAVSFAFCNECWVSNVSVIHGHRSAVYFLWSYRDELRDSYLSESNTAGAPTEYGVECDTCSLYKFENNILFGITSPILIETSYGGVVGYNYMLNTSSGNQFPNMDTHRVHNFLQLSEGNTVGTAAWDDIWGSGSQNTLFRNRASGNDPNKTNYRLPIAVAAWNRAANIVGNVLGDPTFHLTYTCDSANPQAANNFIYEIGFFSRCEIGTASYDAVTLTSVMRWDNWDSVTYCTNGGHSGTACGATGSNGIRTCTASGVGNAACTASETASTSSLLPALASPSTTLPASFYNGSTAAHASCGTGISFWKNPSSGFCPPYPAIGPDVTTGTIANTASHAAKIPAQLCYENSAKTSGFLTAFDATACYALDSAVTVATPAASPVAGTYHGAQTITLSTATGGATICYTVDGTTPTANGAGTCTHGTTYSGTFVVDISLTVQAIGSLSGDTDSAVLSAAYTITHTTWYIRPDGGTKTQCTGLVNAAYPGTGSAQPCAVSHPYWMMNNVPGWTSFIGGDTMQFINTTGTSDTYFTGEQNAGVGIDWNANGLTVPCAPPNPGQANGASCVMPQVPSGTVNAHTKMYGQSVGACHDSGHTHLVNPTILSGIAGAFSIINLRGTSYADIACFGLTQPDTCTTVGNGTGKCGNLSNFVHFGGIVLNYLTGPGPSNITVTDVAAVGIGSQGILGSNMSGTNIFTDVYVIGNGGAGLNGDGGGCGTACESTGTWGLDYNKYAWNGCVAVNYDFTKPYDQNSYNYCMAQQEGSFANGDGFVQIAAGTGFVLTVNHSDFSNNVQDGFDALHLSDDLTTNPAINISNSIAAHNMGQTFKIGAGAASIAINNVAVGDCRALTVDSNYPLNPSGWSAGNQIVGDACRASGGNWVFSLKAGTQITIQNNTTIGYATTTYGAGCISGTTCITGVPHAVGIFQNNTTYALADPGNSGQFASGWFFSNGNPFAQAGGAATFNNWYQMRTGCPDASLSDTNFLCGNPGFAVATVNANQTVITVDPNITSSSLVYHAGTTIGGITSSYNGVARPPFSMGAFEPAINAVTTHTTIGTKHSIGTTVMQ